MKTVKYILAVIIIMAALGGIFTRDFLTSIFFLILGFVLLPPISDNIKENFKLWQNKVIRYASYFVLIILAGSFIDRSELSNDLNNTNQTQNENTEPEKQATSNTSGTAIFDGNNIKAGTQEIEIKEKPKIKMDNSPFWNQFDPIVKERIHKLIENKDCKGLQKEFNTTADNMDRIQNAGGTGSRNLDLMDFLDKRMKLLDCY